MTTQAVEPRVGSTPSWLLQGELGLCPCGCIGRRRKGSFVAKTLDGAAGVMRQALFSQDMAALPGLLQRVDARVKLVTITGLLVVVGLVRSLTVLVALYAATLVLAAASRLRVGFFVRRVWLFIPVFTGIIVLPATLSVVTPGHVVLTMWHWHGRAEGLTAQGLHSAGLLVARVATSVSLVVLLTLTTRWVRLLSGLRAIGVPRIFVLITGMAYRYLYLLLDAVVEMYTARRARTLGRDRDTHAGRRFVLASAGALFGRTQHLSEEVHQAMTARGYRGEPRNLETFRLRAVDAAWTVAALATGTAVLLIDRRLGR